MTTEPVNLADPYARIALAERIKEDIDKYAQATYHDGARKHLGASVIGDDCTRAIYYGFRWFKTVVPSGRLLRLFNRGHKEEARFVEFIKGIGGEIWEVDPTTDNQFRVSTLNGHFGGSLDSIIRLPAAYQVPDDLLFLGEFKTSNTGKFKKLEKARSIRIANPRHFDQMTTYGRRYGYRYSIYFAVAKETDELYVEIVELDWKLADDIQGKAAFVINTRQPPSRISQQDTHFICKRCDFRGVCFHNHVPDKNCRTCVFSVPAENSQWYCEGWRGIIPDKTVRTGCDQWKPIS